MVATMKGKVSWKLEDDNGKVHTFMLKNIYLIREASTRVLSLQPLVQQAQENHPVVGGTGEFQLTKPWCSPGIIQVQENKTIRSQTQTQFKKNSGMFQKLLFICSFSGCNVSGNNRSKYL